MAHRTLTPRIIRRSASSRTMKALQSPAKCARSTPRLPPLVSHKNQLTVAAAGATATYSRQPSEAAQRPSRPLNSTVLERTSAPAERAATADVPVELPSLGYSRWTSLYELTQPLGRGSFKTTYLARERRVGGAKVAVSVLSKERAGTTVEHNLQLIQQEVRSTPGRRAPKHMRIACPRPPLLTTSWSDSNRLMLTGTPGRLVAHNLLQLATSVRSSTLAFKHGVTWSPQCCCMSEASSCSNVQVAITRDLQKCPEVVRFLGVYEVRLCLVCFRPTPLQRLRQDHGSICSAASGSPGRCRLLSCQHLLQTHARFVCARMIKRCTWSRSSAKAAILSSI